MNTTTTKVDLKSTVKPSAEKALVLLPNLGTVSGGGSKGFVPTEHTTKPYFDALYAAKCIDVDKGPWDKAADIVKARVEHCRTIGRLTLKGYRIGKFTCPICGGPGKKALVFHDDKGKEYLLTGVCLGYFALDQKACFSAALGKGAV